MTNDFERLESLQSEPISDKNECDIKEIHLENHLMNQFNNSKFSDITIVGFGQSWKLHRVLLTKSPYLGKRIENETDIILLDLTFWPSLTLIGLEVCFGGLIPRMLSRICTILIILGTLSYLKMYLKFLLVLVILN